MARRKVAVTLGEDALKGLDGLVAAQQYPNRSRAVQAAVANLLALRTRRRLAEECANLDPEEEVALAEIGLRGGLLEGPEY